MTQDTSNSVLVRTVTKLDLDACYEVEISSFPPSEAATRDRIALRIEQYPQGFLVAEVDGRVVGHINSGATDKDDITDEELKALVGHDPAGANMIVFSLAVLPDCRNRGIASLLMKRFVEQCRTMKKHRVLLLCKDDMIGFYKRLGFRYAGVSDSTYGGASWHAMEYALAG
jgi:ribosomal protein S18 acetylase RimI-like enzyme